MKSSEVREIIDEKINWETRHERADAERKAIKAKLPEVPRQRLIDEARTEYNLATVRSFSPEQKFRINSLWLEFIRKEKISVDEMWALLKAFKEITNP